MRDPIQTGRLLLRDITVADAELLFDLDSDPEVMRYIGPRPAADVEGYRERTRTAHLKWQEHPWHGVRLVFDLVGGEFLGWVFVRPATSYIHASLMGWTRDDEVEVGYRYRRSAWGRGIATEAATPLVQCALEDSATSAIVGCALTGNAGSLRVLEKLGLAREGEVDLPDANQRTIKLARRK